MNEKINIEELLKGSNMIRSICWDITTRCNDNCGFCYRNQIVKELNLESNKIILRKLIDFGVDKITFVGGEPLLYTDLFDLVSYGKRYAGGKTLFSITTNAIALSEESSKNIVLKNRVVDSVLNTFDWISFPLDAADELTQAKMGRNRNHFNRVISLLDYMQNRGCNSKVKINTIITKQNKGQLSKIYELLCKYEIARWKIFQFFAPRGNAKNNKDIYDISDHDFDCEIKSFPMQDKIKISINEHNCFLKSYIMLSPDGKLITYSGKEYRTCMDILNENITDLLKFVDINEHKNRRSDFLYA